MPDQTTPADNFSFAPPWWLAGPHRQTLWAKITSPRSLVQFRRESLETPDGDELILDHLEGRAGLPRVLLLHGLEGSSFSVYIQGLAQRIAHLGWSATALNFRSCARDPKKRLRWLANRRPRLYHSGETTDLDFVVSTLSAREPAIPLYAVGGSLGGNVLLKWLGEHPNQNAVAAAATISVPYDLGAGSRYMENFSGRLYVASFLRTLRVKAIQITQRFPETAAKIDLAKVQRARTFFEFDDAGTGPLHGFSGAQDYYARSSSLHFVSKITTPTLCVSSRDDPFLPAPVLERVRASASPSVQLVATRHGGHLGFIDGRAPWQTTRWAEERVVDWLARQHASAS